MCPADSAGEYSFTGIDTSPKEIVPDAIARAAMRGSLAKGSRAGQFAARVCSGPPVDPRWRRQWWTVGALLALGLPVLAIDLALLGPHPGGWISLDLRGLLVGAWLALVLVDAAVTSVLVGVTRGRAVVRLHLLVLGASLAVGALALLANR